MSIEENQVERKVESEILKKKYTQPPLLLPPTVSPTKLFTLHADIKPRPYPECVIFPFIDINRISSNYFFFQSILFAWFIYFYDIHITAYYNGYISVFFFPLCHSEKCDVETVEENNEKPNKEPNLYLYDDDLETRPHISTFISSLANYENTIPAATDPDAKAPAPSARMGK